MTKGRRPGVTTIGQVVDDGKTVTISGWGLTLCTARCTCHIQPLTHNLVLQQDAVWCELGLQHFRACTCCAPWTAIELGGFLRDLAAIEALGAEQPS